MTDFNDLIKPITADEAEEAARTVATGLGLKVTNWHPFGVFLSSLKAFSRSIAVWSNLIVDLAKSIFLETATGGWLTFLAWSNYGVLRNPAEFAVEQVAFTNTLATGVATLAAGDVAVKNPNTQQTYRTLEDYTSLGLDTILVWCQAVNIGSVGSSAPGQVTELETSIVGVTVSNPNAFVGVDEELDEPLRQRARMARAPTSPAGAKDAYRYVLTSRTLNPTIVPITRVMVRSAYETGDITCYVGTAAGAPSPADIATCLATLTQTGPGQVEPEGHIVDVVPVTEIVVNISATVTLRKETLSDTALTDAYAKRASDYLLALDIGGDIVYPSPTGRLDASMLAATLATFRPNTKDFVLGSPILDVPCGASDVFKLGTFFLTVIRQ